jgi:hypothetical protein
MPARKPKPKRRAARKAAPPPPVAAPARMGQPAFVPTDRQRQWVTSAAGLGIGQREMATKLGIARATLRKALRAELDNALPDIAVAVHANLLRIATGDSKSAAWAGDRWLERRMPHLWRVQPVEIANPPGEKLRVVVEFVGDAADTGARPATGGDGKRASDAARKSVDLVG